MLIYLIILLIIIICRIKYNKQNSNDIFKKQETTSIKGIFTIIIFLSHYNSYAMLNNSGINHLYLYFFKYVSQLMVVPFLFYSGYSICYSVKSKENYIKKFPRNRILNIILKFDFAVLLYMCMNYILNNHYNLKTNLLSFTGWRSIGNSNWFIFSLICLYIISYVTFKFFKSHVNFKSITLILLLTIILIIALKIKKEPWWYDILVSYPFGMYVYLYKDKITNFISKKYFVCISTCILLFVLLHSISSNVIIYESLACVFSIIIVLFSYKFKVSNKVLLYIGSFSFEIYILQRIPDIILKDQIIKMPILYCLICFVFTLLLSIAFNKIYNKLNRSIIKK